MNTPNDVMSSPFGSAANPHVASHPTQPFLWSVRRELWENRAIYIAPLAVAGVALFGFLLSILTGRFALWTSHQHDAALMPYDFAAGMIMFTSMIVGFYYSLDALYGERRDRSILFWKSLPVSDLTAVVSKAIIPIFILQFIGFAITVALQLSMLALGSAAMVGKGQSPAMLWSGAALFEMFLMLLYHLFTIHMLWHAPIYGWLMMVSAWARRTPLLWAVLPPLGVMVVEKIAFDTAHFAHLLGYRFAGGPAAMTAGGGMPIHAGTHLTFGRFLIAPGLWGGLIVCAAFLIVAARLRRYRAPI